MGKDPTGPKRKEPTIRRSPRTRRHVGPVTLRLARIAGFRYDKARDALVLRVVGNHVGPVLRKGPPVDSAAAQLEWSDSMDALAARRKTGRFVRDPEPAGDSSPNLIEH